MAAGSISMRGGWLFVRTKSMNLKYEPASEPKDASAAMKNNSSAIEHPPSRMDVVAVRFEVVFEAAS